MRVVRGSSAVPRRLRLLKPMVSRSGRMPDRLEAWVIALLGLLAAGSAAVVGVLSVVDYGRLAASAAADARARHVVNASLRPDIPVPAGRATVAPPLSGSEVFITAVLGGVLWESAALAVLGGVYLIGCRLLDKHRARLWERALSGDVTAP
ncbi:hypothetical protein OG439_07320 [Amycolatopsis sp. NBC_01307]|uniref:hypothetical protein n=1 Tax=Amycolatopsis sp. NBC_01307 TaxID=2903561 RepID=UPI002E0E7706|nr:hypothetical protein OG439_07320 [Amycolatopsis sp. NBC_01307]